MRHATFAFCVLYFVIPLASLVAGCATMAGTVRELRHPLVFCPGSPPDHGALRRGFHV